MFKYQIFYNELRIFNILELIFKLGIIFNINFYKLKYRLIDFY